MRAAEDILQDALVKRLDHADDIRESSIGWMYRVLRNAIIDHARRRAAEARRVERLTRDAEATDDPELRDTIYRCVGELATTLKPEYADALASSTSTAFRSRTTPPRTQSKLLDRPSVITCDIAANRVSDDDHAYMTSSLAACLPWEMLALIALARN